MACDSYGVTIDHDFNIAITLERATEYLVLTPQVVYAGLAQNLRLGSVASTVVVLFLLGETR
ncbi:MAG: hypothetical protein C7B47_00450 [Sulfobacillus thermosulfidooxidans]|uniref:Uncharacterized protein n=1 Tax=Sulfobacillus thermosulfidooxidans TaxID=28034 RepID=A0A2T2X5R6_SULTH|nr:MAG: hypothetical protein C7B47_00450 [Sulfobacillus thermosulfidooxidans]